MINQFDILMKSYFPKYEELDIETIPEPSITTFNANGTVSTKILHIIDDITGYELSSEIPGYLINIEEGKIISSRIKREKSLFENELGSKRTYIRITKSKKYNRSRDEIHCVADLIYKHKYGTIPKDKKVIHKNGNTYDNRIDNLILTDKITKNDICVLKRPERPNTI